MIKERLAPAEKHFASGKELIDYLTNRGVEPETGGRYTPDNA
jgi:hypothetical protein